MATKGRSAPEKGHSAPEKGHSAPEKGREVELKYAMDDTDAVRELVAANSIAGLHAGPWRTLDITDRYVDTSSRELAKAGLGARLRQVDHRTSLTIKADDEKRSSASALHDRVELEGPASRKLDPSDWPPSDARSLLQQSIGSERLRTLFTVTQRRVERDLVDDEGSILAMLSVDEADVYRRGRKLGSFTSLEVEAARDALNGRGALDRVAAELEASGLIRPEGRSKQQIGLEMAETADAATAAERPPRTPGVTADDAMAEAGRKVLRMHLLRMLAAEAPARAGTREEGVHKMRVATRRMRAAWRVFNGAYRPKLQRRYVAELRDVAQALGAVRDMDVQLERLAEYVEGSTEATSRELAPLVSDWGARRDEAHDRLVDLLESQAYEKFVNDYRDFVDTPDAGVATDNAELVRDAAAGRIWRAYERMRAHDGTLPYADNEQIHQLRIDGKRLRYTLEFFREILPASTDQLIAQLTAQQDHLGLLNDAQVAATMTREWLLARAASASPESRSAAARYLAASEKAQARLRRSFTRQWRRLAGRPFRRRLALAVSEV